MRTITIPIKVIPEHQIYGCIDCPDFEHRGGSYGEYHACRNWDRRDTDLRVDVYSGFPDDCPRLKTTT